MPIDLFVSYARVDREVVQPFKEALEKMNLEVFFDVEDMRPGYAVERRIREAITECWAVLGCWTPYALTRDWCGWECTLAVEQDKLVAVEFAPLTATQIVPPFFRLHRAKLSDFTGRPDHEGWWQVRRELANKLEAWALSNDHDPKEVARKLVALRGGDTMVPVAPKPTALHMYLGRMEQELERSPWALHAPIHDNGVHTTTHLVLPESVLSVDLTNESASTLREVYNRSPTGRFVVLGDPGSGKTMALKHFGLWCLRQSGLTPIFLRASELRRTLAETMAAHETAGSAADVLLNEVRAGRAVLLVDSIDEVDKPDEKAKVRRRLADMAQHPDWQNCAIFSASRNVGYIPVPGYYPLKVLPMSESSMIALLERWGVARARIDELLQERRADGRLGTMCQNPLLVTLMAIVLRSGGTTGNWSRTTLYRKVIDVLLSAEHKQDAEGSTPYPYGGLALDVLGSHALAAHGTDRRDAFTVWDAERVAPTLVRRMEDAAPDGRVDGFLAQLAIKTGLIDMRGPGRFQFPHRTFAEFLAARELAKRFEGNPGNPDLVRVLEAASWDVETEQAAWQPYFAKLVAVGFPEHWAYARVDQLSEGEKESVRSYSDSYEFTLRPEHEATTAEVVALTHGILRAAERHVDAGRLLDAVLDRNLSPYLVARIGQALDALDVPTAHRLFDAIPAAPHWELRRSLLLDAATRLGDAAETLRLCQERAARVTHGADLYWISRVATWLGDGTIATSTDATLWAARFWAEHRPEARRDVLAALSWVALPSGPFEMGSPDGQGDATEHPRHTVSMDAMFEILSAPVTQIQYEAFDPAHRAERSAHWTDRPDEHPVYNVTWWEAAAFAAWLDGAETHRCVRLPFEVEWEYAARQTLREPTPIPLTTVAWYGENSGGRAHPVRQRPVHPVEAPEAWRPTAPPLYDLLGNVWEWCADLWDPARYRVQARDAPYRHDPTEVVVNHPASADSPEFGTARVNRGGSWFSPAYRVRVGYRFADTPNVRDHVRGFRLVRTRRWVGTGT